MQAPFVSWLSHEDPRSRLPARSDSASLLAHSRAHCRRPRCSSDRSQSCSSLVAPRPPLRLFLGGAAQTFKMSARRSWSSTLKSLTPWHEAKKLLRGCSGTARVKHSRHRHFGSSGSRKRSASREIFSQQKKHCDRPDFAYSTAAAMKQQTCWTPVSLNACVCERPADSRSVEETLPIAHQVSDAKRKAPKPRSC